MNFGRPWTNGSTCDHGLISLPYLDGPKLEILNLPESGITVGFLWLIPITEAELKYKKHYGLGAIEKQFEAIQFNYLDPHRHSVV